MLCKGLIILPLMAVVSHPQRISAVEIEFIGTFGIPGLFLLI